MNAKASSPWRGRLIMIAVVLLFSVPPTIAWVLLAGGWRPGGTVNHGELLDPPVQLAAEGRLPLAADYFAGRWTILHVAADGCAESCERLLDKTARVRVALDKDAGRVQRLLLIPQGAPTVGEVTARGARVERVRMPTLDGLLRDGERLGVSVIDPRGFRILRYPVPLAAEGLLEDLERLLRLSKEQIERFQRMEAQAER